MAKTTVNSPVIEIPIPTLQSVAGRDFVNHASALGHAADESFAWLRVLDCIQHDDDIAQEVFNSNLLASQDSGAHLWAQTALPQNKFQMLTLSQALLACPAWTKLDATMRPVFADWQAERDAREATRQQAAQAVADARATVEAELADAQIELEKRESLAAAKVALAEKQAELAALEN